MEIYGRKFKSNEIIAKANDLSRLFLNSLIFKNFISLWAAYINQKNQNQINSLPGMASRYFYQKTYKIVLQ